MKAYDVKLRKSVIRFIQNGGSKVEAQKIFKIGHDTIYRWLRLQKEKRGNLSAKKRTVFRAKKFTDESLQALVAKKPDATLDEIATALGVRIVSVFYRLKKLGITRKKNRSVHRARQR